MTARKANQPQLTQEQIVSAALKLIDANGLEGHSMRHLGAELGVDPSSLYYYVPSKAVLYNLIVDEIMGALDLTVDDPSQPIEERIVAAAYEYRRTLLVHPRAMPLAAARSLRTAKQLRGVELLLGIFFDAGFSPTEAVTATDVLGMQVLGMANSYAAHVTESEYHEHSDSFDELSADEFPNMTRVLAEGRYLGFEAEFESGVRAIAKGLLAMHADNTLETPAEGGDE